MPRGRGSNRGIEQGSPRGRGRGRGGRGTPRGGSRGAFRGKQSNNGPSHGDESIVFEGHYQDFTLDWDPIISGENSTRGGRGRGRGSFQSPHNNNNYRGRSRGFFQTPRGNSRGGPSNRRPFSGPRGRGLGFSKGPRIPLKILERDRPLLQPIVFIPGEHQKTLFQQVEDILQVPTGIEQHSDNITPSANIIDQIFHNDESGQSSPITKNAKLGSEGNGNIPGVESDPVDIGIITPEKIESTSFTIDIAPSPVVSGPSCVAVDSSVADAAPHGNIPGVDSDPVDIGITITEKPEPTSFIIDTAPSPVVFGPSCVAIDSSIADAAPLGEDSAEETIVYVAPYPKASRSVTPVPSPAPLGVAPTASSSAIVVPDTVESISFSFSQSIDPEVILTKQVEARSHLGLKPTPRSRKMEKKARAVARKRLEQRSVLSLGLSRADKAVMEEGSNVTVDPRKLERRVGDSDVDWGTSEEDSDGLGDVTSGLGGMDIDSDIGDITTLGFARVIDGLREAITIDDLEDAAEMAKEDEEEDDRGSSGQEEEEVFNKAEEHEIGDHEGDSDIESSEEETPRRAFQASLKKIRDKAGGNAVADDDSASEEEPHAFEQGTSGAYSRKTKDINSDAELESEDADDADMWDISESFNMRKKDKHIPPELRAQWERDKAKKAENKLARKLERQLASSVNDKFSHRGKAKKKRNNLRVEGNTLYTGPIEDLSALAIIIRSFMSNLELTILVLPPKPQNWRKRAHMLAEAFRLKSKSLGKGDERYITLIKSTKSGVGGVDESKISSLIKGHSGGHKSQKSGNGTPARVYVQHKDGDEVGGTAPRLNGTNLGFKLLQQMGWSEGDRIGVTAGLVDPLTAIVKTSKLGLGATR